jgi:aminoglycoside 6-adenylyltransferase
LPAILAFAREDPRVRAVILNGSRARAGAKVDEFSDTDVALVVDDLEGFVADETWHLGFGEQLVSFPNDGRFEGQRVHNRLVLYRDGVKVDFLCWPVEVMAPLSKRSPLPPFLDQGYDVLVDKGGLCAGLAAPTGGAFTVTKPSESEFSSLVNEFWWETTYVARNLARGDVLFARYNLDFVMKLQVLLRCLEWYVSMDAGWSYRAGLLGRDLQQHLDTETWSQLESTYSGGGVEELWESLWRTCELFRRVAGAVAGRIDYSYPESLDAGVTAYLRRVERTHRAWVP